MSAPCDKWSSIGSGLTKIQFDPIHSGLTEGMIGVYQGTVRNQGFERPHVFLVRERLMPGRRFRDNKEKRVAQYAHHSKNMSVNR